MIQKKWRNTVFLVKNEKGQTSCCVVPSLPTHRLYLRMRFPHQCICAAVPVTHVLRIIHIRNLAERTQKQSTNLSYMDVWSVRQKKIKKRMCVRVCGGEGGGLEAVSQTSGKPILRLRWLKFLDGIVYTALAQWHSSSNPRQRFIFPFARWQ